MDKRFILKADAGAALTLATPALRRLVAQGDRMRPFPQAVLDGCYDETQKMHEEYSRADPVYGVIFREMSAFKQDACQWLQLSEYSFHSYQFRRLRR